MRKLQLNLDDLQVETFSTQPRPEDRGTVRGHESEDYTHCCTFTPEFCPTGIYYDTCPPPDTEGDANSGCGCGGGGSDQSCVGASCDYVVETCHSPCQLSYITNCHRCRDSLQTQCIDCRPTDYC